jgi:DNA invertase Pin-like site-specific DNA recombinase
LQDPITIATQKRHILEFAEKKGWKILRWYEEPEQSAKYEEIERRPVFSQLLNDAGKQFQIVLCYMNSRWSRNVVADYTSLTQLRKQRIWWATADGLWDIDKVQQDGFDVAFAVDTQINASCLRQLSKRTIDGKEDRARDGYHNGNVPFGYLAPEYPKAPDGAPSTWRPPRMPVRPDPVTFPALVKIGELTARGWTDKAIADELEGYISKTARFGERLLTKDTIAAIRRSYFPREFAPGCGHGTIVTPAGDLVEGKHQAVWPYALWQRMDEVKMSQFRRPTKEAQRRPHEFSRIIVCAACRRRLRVMLPKGVPYYKDTSKIRKLDCPLPEALSVKAANVIYQFGDILRSVELPENWREAIAVRCSQEIEEGSNNEAIKKRRAELEAEQKRLVTAFTKGYMAEEDLDAQIERIRSELFNLPLPLEQDTAAITQTTISAGETLIDMAGYWSEATPEERRDIVGGLLMVEGLIYDLERQTIVGLIPHPSVLPVLTLGLEKTEKWEQRERGLWLRGEYWPPKRDLTKRHLPPPAHPSLSPAQREEAIKLLKEPGMSLRKVAAILGTSRETIHRLAQQEGIELEQSQKLTPEQREEAFLLLEEGISLRQTAKRFGVSPESLRRLVKRHKQA